jgi:hypothetical protein
MIVAIVDELAPALVARHSIGHGSAALLLLTAGDNAERLQSEASFAALCDVSTVPASSEKNIRHRLNRAGDRAPTVRSTSSPSAGFGPISGPGLHRKACCGRPSKLEAIRCLKRYIAREVFSLISQRKREINQGRNAA